MLLDQRQLQHLHLHQSEGHHWSVVVQSGNLWFLGHRDDDEDLEAAGYLAELEGRTEDCDEDSGQLVCTVLQGGGRQTHRQGHTPSTAFRHLPPRKEGCPKPVLGGYVRASSRVAVLLSEESPDFALLHDEGRWKGGVAGRRRSCDGSRVQSDSQTERKNYSAGRPSWGRRLGQQYSSSCSC